MGLIAGNGQFPLLIAKAARRNGLEIFAIAHEGETEAGLSVLVDSILWLKIGQLERTLKFFLDNGVTEAVIAGGITKAGILERAEIDQRALALLVRLGALSDDSFLRGMAEDFEKDGLTIRPATFFTPELLAPTGLLAKRPLSEEEELDIDYGWRMAKALGDLDIGQLVVVRNRTIAAVEAIEGSDETIRRGGRLAGRKAVVVKICKPRQDLRFDLPAVGLRTIEIMAEVQATALAIEAGRTIIFDREETLAAADNAGIAVIARSSDGND